MAITLTAPLLFACDAQDATDDATFVEDGTIFLSERDSSAPDSICECADDACVSEWIDESFGCDACVLAVCDGERVGGCSACDADDEQREPAAGSCTSDDQCGDGEVCQITECGDDAVGQCAPPPTVCTLDLRAYCGCDGETFHASSTCPGRPYAHTGECS